MIAMSATFCVMSPYIWSRTGLGGCHLGTVETHGVYIITYLEHMIRRSMLIPYMEGQSGQKEHFLVMINDFLILINVAHLFILINDFLILINHLFILTNHLLILINHLFILINALFVHFGLPQFHVCQKGLTIDRISTNLFLNILEEEMLIRTHVHLPFKYFAN